MLKNKDEGKSMELKESKLHALQLRWSIILASSLNYAGITLLMIFWQLELMYFILLIFGLSLIIGTLVVDIEKTFMYSISGLVMGIAFAVAIVLAPYDIFGESADALSAATIVVLSLIGKNLLISISPYLVGTILGCVIGERLD